jgi:hypothetical protein
MATIGSLTTSLELQSAQFMREIGRVNQTMNRSAEQMGLGGMQRDHVGAQIGKRPAQLQEPGDVLGGMDRADQVRQTAERHALLLELGREVAATAADDGRLVARRPHGLGHVTDMNLRAAEVVAARDDVRDVESAVAHQRREAGEAAAGSYPRAALVVEVAAAPG